MSLFTEYKEGVSQLIATIADTQEENIKKAAKVCAQALKAHGINRLKRRLFPYSPY